MLSKIKVEGFGSKFGYKAEYPYSKKLMKLLKTKVPCELWIFAE